jgi:hypothetical protein
MHNLKLVISLVFVCFIVIGCGTFIGYRIGESVERENIYKIRVNKTELEKDSLYSFKLKDDKLIKGIFKGNSGDSITSLIIINKNMVPDTIKKNDISEINKISLKHDRRIKGAIIGFLIDAGIITVIAINMLLPNVFLWIE